jgi:hypothetical protein
MRKHLITYLLILSYSLTGKSFAQSFEDSISEADSQKHIDFLASDKLKGRVNFSPEQLEAAKYISDEFSSYGLKAYPYKDFYQPFVILSGKLMSVSPEGNILGDSVLYNMVGILPGKTRPEEVIIFSAHYDHVNRDVFGNRGGIFNGANDNASGVTGVLMLARYFSLRNDNERTIIFCLFAGEELGMYGSKVFTNFIEPPNIKAVINIEKNGKHNRHGKNSFFVTGSEKSDLRKILKRNLSGENVKVEGDGLDHRDLFYRSDNYPFNLKGIVAHSIMCSDDNDPCYHKPCDDPDEIDTANMTRIIRAIAKGSVSLISGADTPKWKKKSK